MEQHIDEGFMGQDFALTLSGWRKFVGVDVKEIEVVASEEGIVGAGKVVVDMREPPIVRMNQIGVN